MVVDFGVTGVDKMDALKITVEYQGRVYENHVSLPDGGSYDEIKVALCKTEHGIRTLLSEEEDRHANQQG
jgi:hypothetical protein